MFLLTYFNAYGCAAGKAATLRTVKASESTGRSGFFLCFALTVGRRDIAGASASTGLHRCFPAESAWTGHTAGASSLTAGCAFLPCRLTLAAGLRLGCILLGCVPVLFLLSVGLLFLPGIGLAGLSPAAAVAGASCRTADPSHSRAFSYAGALANPRRRFSGQAQSAADPVRRPLCHHGQGGSEHGVGDYARESRFTAGDSRIQADAGDDLIRLFRHLNNADDEHHPEKHVWETGDGGYH